MLNPLTKQQNTAISLREASVAAADDEDERERGFRNLAGCWANDEGDDDMEAIIREGREGRRGCRSVCTNENSSL